MSMFVRIIKVDLVSLYFLSHFYFLFDLFFIFSIFRTMGLGLEVICHTVTLVTSDSIVTTLIMKLKKRKQKVLEQNDIIQHGHCYKTRVWTDFGQGQGQPDIYKYYNYQSTMDKEIGEHVTWKSCDRSQSGLERSRRTQGLEGVRVRDDVKGHGFLMVYTWCAHVQQRLKV